MLTIRPVGASPLALGSPRRTLEDLRRMESKSTRKSPSHASERKQGEDKSDGNALLDLESSKARRDAADVAAALSHTVHSGLEYMDDVMANELLASAAVKSGSEFEELVLGPGLRLLRYKSCAASAPSPHLESKFDDDTIDACNAPHTPASGGSPSTPSRWSPVALLSYVLRKDAPEAIAMLTELNSTLISSHQSSSSELTADVLNGVCDCLLKFVGGWIESSQSGKEAVEGDQLFPIALVTLVNALFALPARAADLLGLLRSLRALPSLSLLSVPINPLALSSPSQAESPEGRLCIPQCESSNAFTVTIPLESPQHGASPSPSDRRLRCVYSRGHIFIASRQVLMKISKSSRTVALSTPLSSDSSPPHLAALPSGDVLLFRSSCVQRYCGTSLSLLPTDVSTTDVAMIWEAVVASLDPATVTVTECGSTAIAIVLQDCQAMTLDASDRPLLQSLARTLNASMSGPCVLMFDVTSLELTRLLFPAIGASFACVSDNIVPATVSTVCGPLHPFPSTLSPLLPSQDSSSPLVWADIMSTLQVYTVTRPGTVVSWCVRSHCDGPLQLVVWRPVGSGVYTRVGTASAFSTPSTRRASTGLEVFHIPLADRFTVQTGDVIGVRCLLTWPTAPATIDVSACTAIGWSPASGDTAEGSDMVLLCPIPSAAHLHRAVPLTAMHQGTIGTFMPAVSVVISGDATPAVPASIHGPSNTLSWSQWCSDGHSLICQQSVTGTGVTSTVRLCATTGTVLEVLPTPLTSSRGAVSFYDSDEATVGIVTPLESDQLAVHCFPVNGVSHRITPPISAHALLHWAYSRLSTGVVSRDSVILHWKLRMSTQQVSVGSLITSRTTAASHLAAKILPGGNVLGTTPGFDATVTVNKSDVTNAASPALAASTPFAVGLGCHATVLALWATLSDVVVVLSSNAGSDADVSLAHAAAKTCLRALTSVFQQLDATNRSSLRRCLRVNVPNCKDVLGAIMHTSPSLSSLAMDCLAAGVQVIIASPKDVLTLLESDAAHMSSTATTVITGLLAQQQYIATCFLSWIHDVDCSVRLEVCVTRAVDRCVSGDSGSLSLVELACSHLTDMLVSHSLQPSHLSRLLRVLSNILTKLCDALKSSHAASVPLLQCLTLGLYVLCDPDRLEALCAAVDVKSLVSALSSFVECRSSECDGVDVTALSELDTAIHTAAGFVGRLFRTLSLTTDSSPLPLGALWTSTELSSLFTECGDVHTTECLSSPLLANGIDIELMSCGSEPELSPANAFVASAVGMLSTTFASDWLKSMQDTAHTEAKRVMPAKKFQAFGGLSWGNPDVDGCEGLFALAMLKHCGLLDSVAAVAGSSGSSVPQEMNTVFYLARRLRRWYRDTSRMLSDQAPVGSPDTVDLMATTCAAVRKRLLAVLCFTTPSAPLPPDTIAQQLFEIVTNESISATSLVSAAVNEYRRVCRLATGLSSAAGFLAATDRPSVQTTLLCHLRDVVYTVPDFNSLLSPSSLSPTTRQELSSASEALLQQLVLCQGRCLDANADCEDGVIDVMPSWTFSSSSIPSDSPSPSPFSASAPVSSCTVELPQPSAALTASFYCKVLGYPTPDVAPTSPMGDFVSSAYVWTSIRAGSQFERVRIVSSGSDHTFDVDFDDGTRATGVPHTHLFRSHPTSAMLPSTATPESMRSHRAAHRVLLIHQSSCSEKPTLAFPLSVGTPVWANYRGACWYPGSVRVVNSEGTYDIQYDDGDSESAVAPHNLAHPDAMRHALQDLFVMVTPTGQVEVQLESSVLMRMHTSQALGVVPLQQPMFTFSTLTSTAKVPLDTWTHVTVTVDGEGLTSKLALYINGRLDASTQLQICARSKTVVFGSDAEPASVEFAAVSAVPETVLLDLVPSLMSLASARLPTGQSSSPQHADSVQGPTAQLSIPPSAPRAHRRHYGSLSRFVYLLLPAFARAAPVSHTSPVTAETRLAVLQICLEGIRRGSSVADQEPSPRTSPLRVHTSPKSSQYGSPGSSPLTHQLEDITRDVKVSVSSNAGAMVGMLAGTRPWQSMPVVTSYAIPSPTRNTSLSVLPGNTPMAVLEITLPEASRLRFSALAVCLPGINDRCPKDICVSVSTSMPSHSRDETLSGLAPSKGEFVARRVISVKPVSDVTLSPPRSTGTHGRGHTRTGSSDASSGVTSRSSPTDTVMRNSRSSSPVGDREELGDDGLSQPGPSQASSRVTSSPVLDGNQSWASTLPESRWVTILRREQLSAKGIGRTNTPLCRIRIEILSTFGSASGNLVNQAVEMSPQLDGLSVLLLPNRRVGEDGAHGLTSPGSVQSMHADRPDSAQDVSLASACFQRVALLCTQGQLGDARVSRRGKGRTSELRSPRLQSSSSPSLLASSPSAAESNLSSVCLELLGNSLREVVTQVKVPTLLRAVSSKHFTDLAHIAVTGSGVVSHLPAVFSSPIQTPMLAPFGMLPNMPSLSLDGSMSSLPDLSLGSSAVDASSSMGPSQPSTIVSRRLSSRTLSGSHAFARTGIVVPPLLSSAALPDGSPTRDESFEVQSYAPPPTAPSQSAITRRCRSDARVMVILRVFLQMVKSDATSLPPKSTTARFLTQPFRFFTIVRLLKHAPLPAKLMSLRLLRYVLPQASPADWQKTLSAAVTVESLGSDVVSLMLGFAQDCCSVCVAVGPSPPPHRKDSSGGDDDGLQSPPPLVRTRLSAHTRATEADTVTLDSITDAHALAHEAVMVLRHIVNGDTTAPAHWRAGVAAACASALSACVSLSVSTGPFPSLPDCTLVLRQAAACVSVLGGVSPTVRPGSLVTWKPSIATIDIARSNRYRPNTPYRAVVIALTGDGVGTDTTDKDGVRDVGDAFIGDSYADKVVKILILSSPDEDGVLDAAPVAADTSSPDSDGKAQDGKDVAQETSSQLYSRIEFVLLSELIPEEEEAVLPDLVPFQAVKPFFLSVLVGAGETFGPSNAFIQFVRQSGLHLLYLELRCMAVRTIVRLLTQTPNPTWLLQCCADVDFPRVLFAQATLTPSAPVKSMLDAFLSTEQRTSSAEAHIVNVRALEGYVSDLFAATSRHVLAAVGSSDESSNPDSRSQSPVASIAAALSSDTARADQFVFVSHPSDVSTSFLQLPAVYRDAYVLTVPYRALPASAAGLIPDPDCPLLETLLACSGHNSAAATAADVRFDLNRVLLIVVPSESITSDDITAPEPIPGCEPMSRRTAAGYRQSNPQWHSLPWGNVLHTPLANLPSAVMQAECMGFSAILVTSLPMWAAQHSASGHPTSFDDPCCDCSLDTLPVTPDVVTVKAVQGKLRISVSDVATKRSRKGSDDRSVSSKPTSSPTMSPSSSPQSLDVKSPTSLRSSLPIYVISQRDGLYLESRMVDLVCWGSKLSPGAPVDCRLPLLDRWHGGSVYAGLTSPFTRWLRVGFSDLPLCCWRWVERPITHACWSEGMTESPPTVTVDPITLRLRWGPNDIAPPGWVSSWVCEVGENKPSPNRLVGKRVSVQWARSHWYDGVIDEYDVNTGMYHVTYDDGDVRWYDMSKKVFRIVETSQPGTVSLPSPVDMDSVVRSVGVWRASLQPGSRLDVLDDHFRWHEAEVKRCLPSQSSVSEVEVRYLGWSFASQPDKFDEVIPCGSHRLAPPGTKTTRWRHVQMGDHVTIWVRPGSIVRNELRDYTVVALAPSSQLPRNNALSLYQVGLSRGQVDVGTGPSATGLDGFGDPNASDVMWVDLDDYHQICNYSTHRAGDWMLVDREKEETPPKILKFVSPVWSISSSTPSDLNVFLSGSYDALTGAALTNGKQASGTVDVSTIRRIVDIAKAEGIAVDDSDVACALTASCGDAIAALGLLTIDNRSGVDVLASRRIRILRDWGGGSTTSQLVSGSTSVPSPLTRGIAGVYNISSQSMIVSPSCSPSDQQTVLCLPADTGTSLSVSFWLSVESTGAGDAVDALSFPLSPGATVWANFKSSGSWYPGRIVAVNADNTYHVAYDDGDTEVSVPEECLSDRKLSFGQKNRSRCSVVVLTQPPLSEDAMDNLQSRLHHPVPENTAIRALYRDGPTWLEGSVVSVNPDGTYEVQFPHGERQSRVPPSNIRERLPDSALRRQKMTIEVSPGGRVILRLKTTSGGRSTYQRLVRSSFQRLVSRSLAETAGSSQWHHIAAVVGPSKLELYVDGALEGTLNTSTVVPRGPAIIIGDRDTLVKSPTASSPTGSTVAVAAQGLPAAAEQAPQSPLEFMSSILSAAHRASARGGGGVPGPSITDMVHMLHSYAPGSTYPRSLSSSGLFGALTHSVPGPQPPEARPKCVSVRVAVRCVRAYSQLLSPDAVRDVMRSYGSGNRPVEEPSSPSVDVPSDVLSTTVSQALQRCHKYVYRSVASLPITVDGDAIATADAAMASLVDKLSCDTEFTSAFRALTSAKSDCSSLALGPSGGAPPPIAPGSPPAFPLSIIDLEDNAPLLWKCAAAGATTLRFSLAQAAAWALYLRWPESFGPNIGGRVPKPVLLKFVRDSAAKRLHAYPTEFVPFTVDSTTRSPASDSKETDAVERESKDDEVPSPLPSVDTAALSSVLPRSPLHTIVRPLIRAEWLSIASEGTCCQLLLSESVGHILSLLYRGDADPVYACNIIEVFVREFAACDPRPAMAQLVFSGQVLEVLLRGLIITVMANAPSQQSQSSPVLSIVPPISPSSASPCLAMLRLCTALIRGSTSAVSVPLDALAALQKGFERFLSLDGRAFTGTVFVCDIAQQLVTLFVSVRQRLPKLAPAVIESEVKAVAAVSIVPIPAPAPTRPPRSPPVPKRRTSNADSMSDVMERLSVQRSPLTASTSPVPPGVFAMDPDGSAALIPIPPGDLASEDEDDDDDDGGSSENDDSEDEQALETAVTPPPSSSPPWSGLIRTEGSSSRQISPFAAVLEPSWAIRSTTGPVPARSSPSVSSHWSSDHEDPDLDAVSTSRRRGRRTGRNRGRRGSQSSSDSIYSALSFPATHPDIPGNRSPNGGPRPLGTASSTEAARRTIRSPSPDSDTGSDTRRLTTVEELIRSWTTPGHSTAMSTIAQAQSASAAFSSAGSATQSSVPPLAPIPPRPRFDQSTPSSIRAILSRASDERSRQDDAEWFAGYTSQRSGPAASSGASPLRSSLASSGAANITLPVRDPMSSMEHHMLAAALAMSLRDVAAGVSSYASLSSPVNTLPSSQTCPADLLSTVCDVVTFVSPTRDDPWPEATDRAIILYLNGIDNQARVTGTLSSSFPSMAANPSTIDIANLQMAYTALQTVSFTSVIDRLRALQVFNSKFTAVLPFLDLSTNPHSLLTEAQLSRARVCVLLAQEDELLRRCLVATQTPDYRPSVTLNRFAAIKHPNRNMFRQLMRQLETVVSPTGDGFIAAFRSGHSGNRPWHVRSFVGEHGLDLGGLFNSSLTEAIEAAMSPLSYSPVPLFIPTPNNRAGSGSDRDKLTFHPEATTPAHLAMFKFLGQLIGVTIRLSFPVDVRLSRLFWKAVVGDAPTLSDLESVDSVFVEQMRRLSVPSPDPVLLQHLHMCVVMSDGSVKDLVTGGSSVPVTLATVPLYVQLATRARLEECLVGVRALIDGISSIIPLVSLRLYTWDEAEALVCGKNVLDIELLKRHTEYGRGMDGNSPFARMFWGVLSSLTPEEQGLFLRFTYARTRLPTTDAGFTRKFKLQRMSGGRGGDTDATLPIAHTCVFQLSLPEYSSVEVMRRQLLLACTLCVGYDLDDAGTATAPFDEDGDADD